MTPPTPTIHPAAPPAAGAGLAVSCGRYGAEPHAARDWHRLCHDSLTTSVGYREIHTDVVASLVQLDWERCQKPQGLAATVSPRQHRRSTASYHHARHAHAWCCSGRGDGGAFRL